MIKLLFSKFVFVIGFLLIISNGCSSPEERNADGSLKTERQKLVESQFSSWDGSHPKLTELIKSAMKNPDSYEHVETRFADKDDHILVIAKYRGTNSFGAVVTSTTMAKVNFSGDVIEILN